MTFKPQAIATTIYLVDDLNQACDWYEKALGFKPYFKNETYIGFNANGSELGLQTLREVDESLVGLKRTNNVRSYWQVEDIKAQYDFLKSIGASAFEPIIDVGGGILIGALQDPWQNAIGLIQNPHFLK